MGAVTRRRFLRLTVWSAMAVGPRCVLGQLPAVEEDPASPSKSAGLRTFTAGHRLHWHLPGIVAELASAFGFAQLLFQH